MPEARVVVTMALPTVDEETTPMRLWVVHVISLAMAAALGGVVALGGASLVVAIRS